MDAIEEEREAKKAKSLAADKDEYDDAEDQEEQGNQMEESSDDSSLIGFEGSPIFFFSLWFSFFLSSVHLGRRRTK